MRYVSLLPVAGLVIFACIIFSLGPSKIVGIILSSDPFYLFLSVMTTLLLISLKALKWRVLIKGFGHDYPQVEATKSWLIGFFIGIVTPGRIGDLSRALYLKGKLKPGEALSTVVADRVLDILSLFVLGLFGAAVLVAVDPRISFLIPTLILAFIIFIAAAAFSMRKSAIRRLAMPIFSRAVPASKRAALSITFHDFYGGLNAMLKRKRRMLFSFLITMLAIPVLVLQCYFIVLALGMDIPLSFLLFMIPVVILIEALPISFSGLGTRDVAMIFLFSMIGYSAEQAVSVSIMMFLFSAIIFGTAGFLLWLRRPIGFRDILKDEP